jgi:uncharacterized membrane protein
MKNKFIGAIATAAAISFVVAPVTSTLANAGGVKAACYGVNACKGKSACKTASSSCKGTNACKGKGVVMATAKKCAKLGGTATEPKS